MLIIPVLTAFVHVEDCVFVPFCLDFGAISGSLNLYTISSCQQLQNAVRFLSDSRQQGQSSNWQIKLVKTVSHLESGIQVSGTGVGEGRWCWLK